MSVEFNPQKQIVQSNSTGNKYLAKLLDPIDNIFSVSNIDADGKVNQEFGSTTKFKVKDGNINFLTGDETDKNISDKAKAGASLFGFGNIDSVKMPQYKGAEFVQVAGSGGSVFGA